MSRHLTDDELIDRLYGLDSVAHLQSCAACTERLRVFEQRKSAALGTEPAIPAAFFSAQRNQILEKVERRPGFRLAWVPAVAVGALVAAVALVPNLRLGPAALPEKAVQQESAEDQLFLEVFAQELAEEPRAASPIRGLFEENQ